jgi:AraC family transcriptional regulator
MVTYDDPQTTPTQELRSDAGIMTPDSFDPSANPQISTCVVGNGRYAIARHKGPYAGLPGAWQEFGRWIAAQKSRSRSGPCFEVYRNDMETAAPEDLLTELYWPVE